VNEYREWLRLKAVSSDAAFAEYVNGRQPLRLRVFRGSARRGAPSMAHGDATPPTATNGCLRRARSQARPDQGELAGSHNGSRRPPPDPPEGWMRRRVRRDALCGEWARILATAWAPGGRITKRMRGSDRPPNLDTMTRWCGLVARPRGLGRHLGRRVSRARRLGLAGHSCRRVGSRRDAPGRSR